MKKLMLIIVLGLMLFGQMSFSFAQEPTPEATPRMCGFPISACTPPEIVQMIKDFELEDTCRLDSLGEASDGIEYHMVDFTPECARLVQHWMVFGYPEAYEGVIAEVEFSYLSDPNGPTITGGLTIYEGDIANYHYNGGNIAKPNHATDFYPLGDEMIFVSYHDGVIEMSTDNPDVVIEAHEFVTEQRSLFNTHKAVFWVEGQFSHPTALDTRSSVYITGTFQSADITEIQTNATYVVGIHERASYTSMQGVHFAYKNGALVISSDELLLIESPVDTNGNKLRYWTDSSFEAVVPIPEGAIFSVLKPE